ncbi:MAG: VanW family protein [Clostridia bacterium]|nr:VanW family protein [Clostridia bacterium]
MGFKRKLSVLTILIIAAISSIGVTVVKAESAAVIELYYENESYVYIDEYISPSNHLIALEVFERSINAPLSEKMEIVSRKLKSGADYKTALSACFPLLVPFVDDVINNIEKQPQNSEIRFDPSKKRMFLISREKSGIMVQEDRLYMDIYFALRASSSARIKVPIKKIDAQISAEDNVKLTNLRSRYCTDFSQSTEERKHNISLALSKLNGVELRSEQVLSFNETVGSRTKKNGFEEAKIIKGGKYVPGIGGGVCQASTTLYNAALLADLSIVAVSRHSLQSSYELPSFDAMVNSGSSDIKIKNSSEFPVFIKAYDQSGKAIVEIYGQALPYVIKRKSEVTFTGKTPDYEEYVDENFEYFSQDTPSGERKAISYSHPEVHSNGYLLYYDKNGNLIQTKHIRSDKYSAVSGVIAIAP